MALKRGADWNRKNPLGGALIRLAAGIIILVIGIRETPVAAVIGGALTALSIFQIIKASK